MDIWCVKGRKVPTLYIMGHLLAFLASSSSNIPSLRNDNQKVPPETVKLSLKSQSAPDLVPLGGPDAEVQPL